MNYRKIAVLASAALACLLPALAGATSAVAVDQTAKALIAKGNALYKDKRYGEALVAYTQAIDANPQSDVALVNRGMAYANLGPDNYAAARSDFDKALAINPGNGNAFYVRAVLNKRTGQPQAYQDDLNMAAQLGNEKAKALLSGAAASVDRDDPAGRQRGQAEAAAPVPAARGGNPVEPLSNGLLLNWKRNEVRQKFGDPKAGWVKCQMDYTEFGLDTCYGDRISRAYLNRPSVRLASGIGVGSSKTEVARVFGNPYGETVGQYKLDFSYNGERVSAIKIEPAAGEFAAYSAASAAAPRESKPAAAGDADGLAGMWWCVAPTFSVGGTIHLLPNGTYEMNGAGVAGRYKAANGKVYFDGTLKDWNNGVATLNNGVMEFQWTNREGWKQYFAYRKK